MRKLLTVMTACAALSLFGLGATAGEQKRPSQQGGADGPMPPEAPDMMDERGGPGEEERGALEFIRDQAPEMREDIESMRQKNPEGFRRRMQEFMPAYRDPQIRDKSLRNIRLDFQVRSMARALRQAKGEEKEKIKKELEKALTDQFDAKLAGQEMRVKKMQEEIADLKARIEKRRGMKSEIVKRKLNEMSGDSESWDW